MRNASRRQSGRESEVKVAVITDTASSPEAQSQQLKEQIAIALVGLGALVAAGVA